MSFNKINNISFLKGNGIYYTNKELANEMIDNLNIDYTKRFSLIEPAVGEGHILYLIIERFLKKNKEKDFEYIKSFLEQNIFAFDIRNDAVISCKKKLDCLLSDYYNNGEINWNVFCFDALDFEKLAYLFNKFDYVISNPPYISRRNINQDDVLKIKKNSDFCSRFNFDMYYYFFEIGIKFWNRKGNVVYITPNSYLRAKSAEILLNYIIENRFLEKVIDYGDELKFEGATTYTAITVLSEGNNNISIFNKQSDIVKEIKYRTLKSNKDIYLYNTCFELDEPYVILGDIANIKNGLATLQDKVFIINEDEVIKESKKFLFFKKGNICYKIEKDLLKIAIKPSNNIGKKFIIFPYDENHKKIVLDNTYPLAYRYLKSNLSDEYKYKYFIYFGRTQGFLNYHNRKIIIPKVANLSKEPFKLMNHGFVLSGLSICFYDNYTTDIYNKIISYLNSSKVIDFLSVLSKNYSSGYKSISSKDLKKIKIPRRILMR
ncbi:Eco57I restriction-modification methylase domain-containing protein [Actinobacillus equuli subsp. equuli]|uniref:site-specific DNA-methyltransferase (adenine-specific) n=1 Tax=Actinobacillus equuli subsp. equuli TaxID=202947 RepID=A0A9X4JCA4_ACTEU|nr:Eco57I restriction-modification methylase domain-containing protein [Actinobacillus equuli]MDE8034781.1 Eco57I restriction-modification methylase domain-containing protein [Actinobacillus equuli subsp. equuli]MDG4949005.1 Eco57I restriction-modification methylase domain-containing protein [Actinobacillus equuli subsp. haemolyticus]WGE87913.1 Eco57I restriction-modification methylase domain-containing protein [Actinobacillus equuli subsp. haemolyticus]